MSNPITPLHYAPNGNLVNGQYAPGADGFNLADVSSKSGLDSLPAGVQGLVHLGLVNGADATFQNTASQHIGDPQLFGFYPVDEPNPTGKWGTQASAANLKAESDWIHAHVPDAKTCIVLMNMGSEENPTYQNTYNPANTDIDLYGLDPYPVKSSLPNGYNLSVIGKAVQAAEASRIPQSQLVPVYQAFGTNGTGAYAPWLVPTATQDQQILSTWGQYLPHPVFDFAYSWGVQDGDQVLSVLPDLQKVFATHNSLSAPPPTVSTDTIVLALSEDRFKGDAQFIAKLDGVTIAGPTAVTAQHGYGQTQTFSYSGGWGGGAHNLEIDFINDKYAGAAKDRNLYVERVTYNGTGFLSRELALHTNGAVHNSIGRQ